MVKVLVIEEDAQTRASAERALTTPELSVVSAEDYQSGLEMLQVQKPTAVVIGISVPDLHGYDLCQDIRRNPELQDTPIVICSAQPYPADVRRAKEYGADEYVIKPYTDRQLTAAVWNAVELRSTVFRVKFWGTRGSIARLTNGTTVAAQRSPTTRNLYGIGCAGPAACYAVGDGGTILALR